MVEIEPEKNGFLKYNHDDCILILEKFGGLENIDIHHPFSGSGMREPSKTYSNIVRIGVNILVNISELFFRFYWRRSNECSPRLDAVKYILRFATNMLSQTSFNYIRQPFLALINPIPDIEEVTINPIILKECTAWWIYDNMNHNNLSLDDSITILYVHGGGCIGGDFAGFRGFCHKLSKELDGCRVLLPNYRFCPEWTLQQGVDDIMECLVLITSLYSKSKRNIVIMGDSGGGIYITLVIQQILTSKRYDLLPICCVMMSPMVNIRPIFREPVTDDYCSTHMIESCCYLINSADPTSPNPIYGNFNGFPPTYICTAKSEILYKSICQIEKILKKSNVNVEMNVNPYTFHAWPLMFCLDLKESEEEITNIMTFIRSHI